MQNIENSRFDLSNIENLRFDLRVSCQILKIQDLTFPKLINNSSSLNKGNHDRDSVWISDLNRPFPHSTSVRTNNRTRARLGWTFSYICCIFVHPNLDSVPLFVGMWERSINIDFYDFIFHFLLSFGFD